jgi:hypothetical protein
LVFSLTVSTKIGGASCSDDVRQRRTASWALTVFAAVGEQPRMREAMWIGLAFNGDAQDAPDDPMKSR